uniref:Uncharacterized protein n=1 Tax=Anguilla anguilla TaxID=7936 RepID=A0A0E9X8A3_ANGAN
MFKVTCEIVYHIIIEFQSA